jgi:hypothetical protein
MSSTTGLRLASGREEALYVKLSESFAEVTFDFACQDVVQLK